MFPWWKDHLVGERHQEEQPRRQALPAYTSLQKLNQPHSQYWERVQFISHTHIFILVFFTTCFWKGYQTFQIPFTAKVHTVKMQIGSKTTLMNTTQQGYSDVKFYKGCSPARFSVSLGCVWNHTLVPYSLLSTRLKSAESVEYCFLLINNKNNNTYVHTYIHTLNSCLCTIMSLLVHLMINQ